MFNIEKWLKAEKSLGITGVGILLSVLIILLIGYTAYRRDQLDRDFVTIGGKQFAIVGMGQVNANGEISYVPVYKEVK